MRTTTISGFTITYPDDIVWVNDHSPLKISASAPVGATIKVIHPAGETKTLTYMSPLNELTFFLDTTLKALHDDNIGDYFCQIMLYSNNVYVTTYTFSFKLYNGKSFQDRTHGTSQHIYLYSFDEAIKLQIYSPSNGTASINGTTFTITKGLNSLNLSGIVTATGIYTICLYDSSQQSLEAEMVGDTPVTPNEQLLTFSYQLIDESAIIGGNIFGAKKIFPICHTIELVEKCSNYPSVELWYHDCDGCLRHLAGNIVNDTTNVSRTGYTNLIASEYKDIPYSTLVDGSQLVKVQFKDIDINANFRDILYSEYLYVRRNYDSELIPVRLKTDTLVVKANDDSVDFELEIYYMD